MVLNSALGLALPTCVSASFARWTAEGGCPSVSFSAAFEAGTANQPVITAVNRCATQKQNQNRVFRQAVQPPSVNRRGSRFIESTFSATAPSLARRRAHRAGTNFPQIEPRINSHIVSIVPRKLQRVLAHRFGRERFHGRLEHRQSPRRQLRRFARFSSRLPSLLFPTRARPRG